MTTMRCPLGHPPGPQPFCPICGRATVPVEKGSDPPPEALTETEQLSKDWSGSSSGPADGVGLVIEHGAQPDNPPVPLAPPSSPAPAAPPTGPSWSDFQSDLPEGPAAAETKRLIDELQAGRPVTPPTFSPPSAPERPRYEPGGVFPSGEIPDYSPTPPPEPPEPSAPSAPSAPELSRVPVAPPVPATPPVGGVPPFEMPARASMLDTFAQDQHDEGAGRRGRSFGLLPLLLVLAVLAGAAYLVSTQLLGAGDKEAVTAPPRSTAPTARTTPARGVQTFSAAQIAASLKDPHFKHGYDAGVLRKKAGAVEDPGVTCRAKGLRERQDGYAWGAHDQQGCIVGITQG